MARATFGGQPSVATASGGSWGTAARTSPPPVWMSRAAVALAIRPAIARAYPQDGRSSVARPSSQEKSQPSTETDAASSISSSKGRLLWFLMFRPMLRTLRGGPASHYRLSMGRWRDGTGELSVLDGAGTDGRAGDRGVLPRPHAGPARPRRHRGSAPADPGEQRAHLPDALRHRRGPSGPRAARDRGTHDAPRAASARSGRARGTSWRRRRARWRGGACGRASSVVDRNRAGSQDLSLAACATASSAESGACRRRSRRRRST